MLELSSLWGEVSVWLVWLWGQWQTQFLVFHILGNFIVAVAVTIYTGEFLLGKLGQFLYKKVLPFVLIYAAFAFIGEAANLAWVATGAWAMLESLLVADLLDNLRKIGLPIPEALTKKDYETGLDPQQRP